MARSIISVLGSTTGPKAVQVRGRSAGIAVTLPEPWRATRKPVSASLR